MEAPLGEEDRLFARFARTGDPRALGEVYDRLAPELLRVALHTTRAAAEAEDVLQATFVTAIERARAFESGQRVMPWLVGILANEARRARERAGRRPDPERLERGAQPGPALDAERAELLERLDRALAAVPEAYRPVLALRLRHDLGVPEIAAALGRPSGTVRSQLARGIECLRRALPAGLAGALSACAQPTRGIAAVRAAVLEHAAALHGPWILTTAIGGLLAVKKLVLAAAALIAVVSLWAVMRPGTEALAPGEPETLARAAALSPPVSPVPEEAAPEPATDRVAVPSSPAQASSPSPAPPGSPALLVHARWPDGTSAEGEIVLVTHPGIARSDEALSVVTDADGLARFPDLPPGGALVRLLRGGEASVQLAPGKSRTVELELQSGPTVLGRVVDGQGAPVAGAAIWLSERYRTNRGHVVTTSDERGTFRLRCVGPDHHLGARKRGFAPTGLRSVRGAPGDEIALELRLDRAGGALHGRVQDPSGAPIAGARVLLGEEFQPSVRLDDGAFGPAAPPLAAVADEHGRFELEGAEPGLQPLQARARGFAPHAGTVEVPPGAAGELVLTLLPEARLVGLVRGPDDSPLPGVWIHSGTADTFAGEATWSELDGRFELGGLGGERLVVRALHPEHGEAELELRPRPGETYTWEVELRRTPRISGRLEDEHGAPLADLVVIAMPAGEREPRTRSERSDADGRFELSGLEERAYRLLVQPPLGWREFPLLEVEEAWPGAPPLVLRVPDRAESGRILAEIAGPDGAPLPGAELQVWHVERRTWRAFAVEGERGLVEAGGIPPGTVELEVRHPDHPWMHLGEHRIEPGATLELGRIALETPGRLRARLSGLPEELELGLRTLLADATNRESGVVRIAAGELTTGPLAPGRHVLRISGDFVRDLVREVEIRPGVEERLELVLERCGLREVLFELPPGATVPAWIACSLLDERGQLVWGGNADCTRTPPVARVSAPPGEYRLWAGGEGGLEGNGPFTIGGLGAEEPPLVLSLAGAH